MKTKVREKLKYTAYYLIPSDFVFNPVELNYRIILGIFQRSRKCLEPLRHLVLINTGNAYSYNTAKEFAGVLWCENNRFHHDPDIDGHALNKSGPCHLFTIQIE